MFCHKRNRACRLTHRLTDSLCISLTYYNACYLLQKFKISIVSQGADRIEFDMIGVDASIANTLRRILIAEVWYGITWHGIDHKETANPSSRSSVGLSIL